VDLLHGVRLTPLRMHRDERGWVSEVFRDEWDPNRSPCQWNVGYSEPNSLRGVHLHLKHQDYFTVVKGRVTIGLFDVRPNSPTYRQSALLEVTEQQLTAITLPTGVLHGVYSHDASMHVYGLDLYYDPGDDIGCR
jgi:dTDP-4-dehydrorhamnose 3,5-epimerase